MEGGLIELPNMLALIIKFKEIKQTFVLITLTFPDFKGFDCTFLNKVPKKMDYEILFIILGIHINKSALDLYATPLKYRPKI